MLRYLACAVMLVACEVPERSLEMDELIDRVEALERGPELVPHDCASGGWEQVAMPASVRLHSVDGWWSLDGNVWGRPGSILSMSIHGDRVVVECDPVARWVIVYR